MPEQTVPKPDISRTGMPEQPVPEKDISRTGMPEQPVSEMDISRTGMPEQPVPETDISRTGMPEQPVPETDCSSTGMPEQPVPETDISRTGMTEQPVPETDSSSTGMPEQPVPETDISRTGMPEQPVPQTDSSSIVMPEETDTVAVEITGGNQTGTPPPPPPAHSLPIDIIILCALKSSLVILGVVITIWLYIYVSRYPSPGNIFMMATSVLLLICALFCFCTLTNKIMWAAMKYALSAGVMPEQPVPETDISSTGMPEQPVPETDSSSIVMPEETLLICGLFCFCTLTNKIMWAAMKDALIAGVMPEQPVPETDISSTGMPKQPVPEPDISRTGMPEQPVPETDSSSIVMPEETDTVAVEITGGNQTGTPPPPPHSLPIDIIIPCALKSSLVILGVVITIWLSIYVSRYPSPDDDIFMMATSVLLLICGLFCFCTLTNKIMWVFCRLVVPFATAVCSCVVVFGQLGDDYVYGLIAGVMLYFLLWYIWLSVHHAFMMHEEKIKYVVALCMDVVCAGEQRAEVPGDMPPDTSEEQGKTVLCDTPPAYSADRREIDTVEVTMTGGNQLGTPPPPSPSSLPTDITIPWTLPSVLMYGGVVMGIRQAIYINEIYPYFHREFIIPTSVLWLICGLLCFCKPTHVTWVFCHLVVAFATAGCTTITLLFRAKYNQHYAATAVVMMVMLCFVLWYLVLSVQYACMFRENIKDVVAQCMNKMPEGEQRAEVPGDMPTATSEDQSKIVLCEAPPAYSTDCREIHREHVLVGE